MKQYEKPIASTVKLDIEEAFLSDPIQGNTSIVPEPQW